jgi:hypothetical protein
MFSVASPDADGDDSMAEQREEEVPTMDIYEPPGRGPGHTERAWRGGERRPRRGRRPLLGAWARGL